MASTEHLLYGPILTCKGLSCGLPEEIDEYNQCRSFKIDTFEQLLELAILEGDIAHQRRLHLPKLKLNLIIVGFPGPELEQIFSCLFDASLLKKPFRRFGHKENERQDDGWNYVGEAKENAPCTVVVYATGAPTHAVDDETAEGKRKLVGADNETASRGRDYLRLEGRYDCELHTDVNMWTGLARKLKIGIMSIQLSILAAML